jgi:hypothetical protein
LLGFPVIFSCYAITKTNPRAGEGTNSPRLFTRGETKTLAKSKVHQWTRAWVTNGVGVLGGWSSSLISKIWRTVMNSGHWLVQFKVCIITTAWRRRNSKHFLIWWLINFLQIYFIFARICKFQKLSQKSAKRREPNVNEGKFVLNIDFIIALKPDGLRPLRIWNN